MSEYPSYLIHYGIEGQKWHERRFQNEDGSYTPEGRIRYGIGSQNSGSFDPDKRIVPNLDRRITSSQESKTFDPDKRIVPNLDRRITSSQESKTFDPDKRIDPSESKNREDSDEIISPHIFDLRMKEVFDKRITPETQKMMNDLKYDENGNITKGYQAWLAMKEEEKQKAERDIRRRIM